MTTQQPRPSRLAAGSKLQRSTGAIPARSFPIEHEIQRLEGDLHAFNERIKLENEGHRGHALEVLKANAMNMSRKIDELRSLLAEPPKKT
jgi:hypothetical protein